MSNETEKSLNFVEEIVAADSAARKWGTGPEGRPKVCTRFPPEPNGYLHIGHSKSIHLNHGLAQVNGGAFNLRFDDTNPVAEEQEYVDSIVRDVRWLGARWAGMQDVTGGTPVPRGTPVPPGTSAARDAVMAGVIFSSDYFQQMHDYAVRLIKKGLAYVCDLTGDQVSEYRGSLTKPGRESPSRNRSAAENLDLFERMRKGEFPDGSHTLRAKIDMASPNLNLRDPIMYRILHESHHRTGDAWCIYPMYDWAHGIEDSIEGITHSICTLEFENHRPLYDWFIDAINAGEETPIHHPQQIEFARLALTHTVMSKRKLLELVKGGHVRGWDDPRMPTLSGLRRRGYTPEAIHGFALDVGVARFNSTIEVVRLENALRDDLNKRAPRRMGVLRPLKVVIENFAEGQTEWLDAINNPEDATAGTRKIPFSRTLYIEQDDFRETPPKGFFRLSAGKEVRLRYAFFVTCRDVVKDASGAVTELRCTYDPATRGGDAPDGRKVKATLHWVSAEHALQAEVRLYDHLFSSPFPDDVPEGVDWKTGINPASLEVIRPAYLEPSLKDSRVTTDISGATHPDRFQFERLGYFCVDIDSRPGAPVFNRTVSLKDTWAKVEKKG